MLPLSPASLTERERQILLLIVEDQSNKEIAVSLGMSLKTVEYHRQAIKNKLGVKGVAGMVRYAIRTGLIDP